MIDINVDKYVEKAWAFFEVREYPGNFFEYLYKSNNYIKRYGIVVYKLNIGKTSGFIGYAQNDVPIICVNCKRPLGHQNFTLAHEIGHWFIHKGLSITDQDDAIFGVLKEEIEEQANAFASEFLYPHKYIINDLNELNQNGLFNNGKELKLADFINELANKYCISFKFAMNKILFQAKLYDKNRVKLINKVITRESGTKINRYGEFMYAQDGTDNHKPIVPMSIIKAYVNELLEKRDISLEAGEVFIERFRDLEDV